MTLKRKVTFRQSDIVFDDSESLLNSPSSPSSPSPSSSLPPARKKVRISSNEAHQERIEEDHPSWYSSLELRAIRKNAVLAMDAQSNRLLNDMLHQSHRRHVSKKEKQMLAETEGGKNGEKVVFDQMTAQTILNIWTTGTGSSNPCGRDDSRRGMESYASPALAAIRKIHRRRVAMGVLIAQKRYRKKNQPMGKNDDDSNRDANKKIDDGEEADWQERVAKVSRSCSASSRLFALAMGSADALAARAVVMER